MKEDAMLNNVVTILKKTAGQVWPEKH